jgi:hypothetical protein
MMRRDPFGRKPGTWRDLVLVDLTVVVPFSAVLVWPVSTAGGWFVGTLAISFVVLPPAFILGLAVIRVLAGPPIQIDDAPSPPPEVPQTA